ncbi:hypothetical protein P885DRAFT_82060 [Corynascus similis CBS 632.67]
MHLPTIVAALLLPLAAVAQDDLTTITSTSTITRTKTITVDHATVTDASSSATHTGHSTTITPSSTLGAANLAALGVAGVVAVALL